MIWHLFENFERLKGWGIKKATIFSWCNSSCVFLVCIFGTFVLLLYLIFYIFLSVMYFLLLLVVISFISLTLLSYYVPVFLYWSSPVCTALSIYILTCGCLMSSGGLACSTKLSYQTVPFLKDSQRWRLPTMSTIKPSFIITVPWPLGDKSTFYSLTSVWATRIQRLLHQTVPDSRKKMFLNSSSNPGNINAAIQRNNIKIASTTTLSWVKFWIILKCYIWRITNVAPIFKQVDNNTG